MNKYVLVSLIFKHLSGMQILATLGKLHHETHRMTGRGGEPCEIMNSLSACICQNGADK